MGTNLGSSRGSCGEDRFQFKNQFAEMPEKSLKIILSKWKGQHEVEVAEIQELELLVQVLGKRIMAKKDGSMENNGAASGHQDLTKERYQIYKILKVLSTDAAFAVPVSASLALNLVLKLKDYFSEKGLMQVNNINFNKEHNTIKRGRRQLTTKSRNRK